MEPKEIVDKLGAFVEKDPGDPRFARVGDAFLKMGDFKNALAVLTKGVKLNPRYFTGQLVLAHTLRQAGYLPQAKERYKIVLRLDPANIAAMWQLSAISFEEDNEVDGIRYLKKILLVNPYHKLAQEELLRRTGKEYGPPKPPQPRREALLPIPVGQEGPIIIDRETEQEKAEDQISSEPEMMEKPEKEPQTEVQPAAPIETKSRKTETEPAGEDFEELFEMDISEMEIIEEELPATSSASENLPAADETRQSEAGSDDNVEPVIVEEEPTKTETPQPSEPIITEKPQEPDQTSLSAEGAGSTGSILGGGALEISEDALFFEEAEEASDEQLDEDEPEESYESGAIIEEEVPTAEDAVEQTSEKILKAEAPNKEDDEIVSFEKMELARESSDEKVVEEEIPDFEERMPRAPEEDEINVSSPEELARLLGSAAKEDEISEPSEIPDETDEEQIADIPEDTESILEKAPEEIASSEISSDEELEDVPDFAKLGDDDGESIVFAEEDSSEADMAEKPVMKEDSEEIEETDDTASKIDENEEIDFGSFGVKEKTKSAANAVEEDTEPIADEKLVEKVPEKKIEETEQILPDDDSEAMVTEDIDGLLTRGGFEPPEEIADEIEGLEVSGGFEPPEEEIVIKDIQTREDFMGQDDEIEPEYLEGIIKSEGFEPEPTTQGSSEDSETEADHDDTEENEVYTVTMAEIYSAQGQIEKALWIYGKILEDAEEDEEIERIEKRMDHLRKILAEKGE